MLAASGGYSSRQGRRSVSPRSPARCAAAERVSTQSVCARVGHRARRLCRLFAFSVPAAPACAVGVVAGAKKPARPRPGAAAPPLWPRPAGRRGRRRRAAPSAGSRHPIFFVSVAVGSSGATPPPPPRRPVSPAAIKAEWGGLRQRSRAPSGRAGALQPRPPFWGPGAGFFLVSLRRE